MKRVISVLVILLFAGYLFAGDPGPGSYWRVSKLTSPVGRALKDSTQVYVKETYTWYQLTRDVGAEMTMRKAIDSGYCVSGGGGVGGSGTVTSISQGFGMKNSVNPITTSGTIAADSTILATIWWILQQGFLTEEIEVLFTGDSSKIIHWPDTIYPNGKIVPRYEFEFTKKASSDNTDTLGVHLDSLIIYFNRIKALQDSLENIFTEAQCNSKFVQKIDPLPAFGIGLDTLSIQTGVKWQFQYLPSAVVIDTIILNSTTTGAGTTNITPKFFYGTDIEAAGTAIISSPSAFTSHTTGTKIYTFNNATIPAGNKIWVTFIDVTTIPKNWTAFFIIHKQ